MFERPDIGERAILVHVRFRNASNNQDLNEFKELVKSTGVEIATIISVQRNAPNVKYLVGSGKVEEVSVLTNSLDADIIIFNYFLTPSQERNLEKIFQKAGTRSNRVNT